MAEEGIKPGSQATGVTPPQSGDSGTPSLPHPAPMGYISTPMRLLIYAGVILVLSIICGWVLHAANYNGVKPMLVAGVLGTVVFLTCRSFLVDRFLKIQPSLDNPVQPIDGAREIVETVVFVVVLVLLLKSFVAEAFQIPTGSMAETLYGNQKVVKCPTCGHRFPVNVSEEIEHPSPDGQVVIRCICDNCLQKIQFDGNGPLPPNYVRAPDASNNSGDRVLVAKFLYDLSGSDPEPLDVVVFKFPGQSKPGKGDYENPQFPSSGPYKLGTQMNYIKRLIGRPGEAIAIQRGKLFVRSPRPEPLFNDAAVEPASLWRYTYMHQASSGDSSKDLAKYEEHWKEFQILRKSPEKILSMHRIVYDQDCTPTDLGAPGGSPVRWAPASGPGGGGAGWNPNGKGFTSAPTGDGHTDWLRYSHILRPDAPATTYISGGTDTSIVVANAAMITSAPGANIIQIGNEQMVVTNINQSTNTLTVIRGYNGTTVSAPAADTPIYPLQPELITDFMAYNNGIKGRRDPRDPDGMIPGTGHARGKNWVGDLVLETEIDVAKAEGEVILELSKGTDRFQARFDLSNGNCKLIRIRNGVESKVGDAVPTAVNKPGTYRLRLANVDQRLTVWVNNDPPFVADDVDNPYHGGPVADNDLHPAGIGVVNAHVTARSIKLYRDLYYTANPGDSITDVEVHKWTAQGDWQTSLNGNMPILFMYVQPGHYLCLGDNSPYSADSRSWGLVPRRLLLGRAMLIYWPVGLGFWPFGPVTRVGRIE